MLCLVILAASVFEISCGKTDRQTDKQSWKPHPPRLASAWVKTSFEQLLDFGLTKTLKTREMFRDLRSSARQLSLYKNARIFDVINFYQRNYWWIDWLISCYFCIITNNNNECIYTAQNEQSSDALTRATKQAGTEVSGKRRHRQWRYGHLVEKRAIRNMFRVWHAHDEMSSLEDKKCRTDRNQSKDVKLQYLSDRISFHFMKFISLFRNLVAHVINYFSTLTF